MPPNPNNAGHYIFFPERTWRSEASGGLRFVITHSDPILVALTLLAAVLWEFNPTQASNTLGYFAGN